MWREVGKRRGRQRCLRIDQSRSVSQATTPIAVDIAQIGAAQVVVFSNCDCDCDKDCFVAHEVFERKDGYIRLSLVENVETSDRGARRPGLGALGSTGRSGGPRVIEQYSILLQSSTHRPSQRTIRNATRSLNRSGG